jgi:DNA-binding transcriptional regulator of glucitol operon
VSKPDEQQQAQGVGLPSEFFRHSREQRRQRSGHHPALLVLTFVAFCVCLLLGFWQWRRFHESGGTFQNLGYALQWPLFAVFTVYSYLRFFGLLKQSREGRDVSAVPRESSAMPPLPKPALPEQPARQTHPGLTAYNALLAELAEHTAPVERNSR